jgi:glyceraldehyde-3-phosphate dehydrogenase (NADP+)
MRFSGVGLLALSCSLHYTSADEATASTCSVPPYVGPKVLIHGRLTAVLSNNDDDESGTGDDDTPTKYRLSDVYGCCGIDEQDSSKFTRPLIGHMPQMSSSQTLSVLKDAETAWDGGSGVWPQMSLRERLQAIENLLRDLETNYREQIVQALMWEIGKNRMDAESEFDRTIAFGRQVMDVVRGVSNSNDSSIEVVDDEFGGSWQHIGSTMAFVRRAAIGIVLCLGPMNYPLNETYATVLPALLMGNVVLMKIPTVGGIVHLLTMEAFQKALPSGAMNFVSGRGRDTMPTLMETGKIDALAFIGGSNAADDLIRRHPHPHRLKVFLQLEAKNMAIFLPDMFLLASADQLNNAMDEAVMGALSFNGQRCTALKLFFLPKGHGDVFSKYMAERIEAMKVGLPWETVEDDSTSGIGVRYSHITPLPNNVRTDLMRRLVDDALSKGAKIVNKRGGEIIGGDESTLMIPAILVSVIRSFDAASFSSLELIACRAIGFSSIL